ncbi:hypothetical protein GCM10009037_29610 [Halarchaeum grantii]|uniref:Pyrrolo-quinoline quinone repeat domain-containing protein n=1 Tax=Halarchaeum grantii TaxID=1193105 RepID=A0A830FDJ3_9EURY|nr:hypothetical protein GCM10009037_29610 [Halarchaeum grantii]
MESGTAYFGTIEDVHAIDVGTGDSVWTYQNAYGEIDQPPSVTEDTVYVSENAGGGVHAISAGERKWYFDDLVGDASQPVPFRDVLYVNAGGTLYELDRASGQVRRERTLKNTFPSTPVIRDDAIYLVTDGELWALDRLTLDRDWTHPVAPSSEVIAHQNTLLVSSQEQTGFVALNRTDGTLAWDTDLRATECAVIADGNVYASERDGTRVGAYALDGRKQWMSDDAGTPSVPAIGSDAVFVVDHHNSKLLALDRGTGDRRWTFRIDAGLRHWPTNASDRVFIPTDEGLYSIEK